MVSMPSPARFVRTPALWTLYALLGLYAFLQNAIGPAIPFLRAEFHLDYTMAALHISAFAIGMVLAGLAAPRLLHRIGLAAGLWGGQAGTLAGLTLLVLAPAPWVSLIGIVFAGFTGTVSLAAIQASVAGAAGPHRGKALLEANIAASLTSAAGPFVLVLGAALGTGWRTLWPAFLIVLVITGLFGFRPLQKELPPTTADTKRPQGKLPRAFVRAWFLIFVGVSVEWSAAFWSATYLKSMPGASVAFAAAGAGVFQLAAVAGRVISSRVAVHWGERRLIASAVGLMALGFPFYWTLPSPAVALMGLVFLGMGASVLYPMGLSLAIEAAGPTLAAKGSSLATTASGSAILLAPLLLGAVADHTGLQNALLAIPIGLVVILALLTIRRRT